MNLSPPKPLKKSALNNFFLMTLASGFIYSSSAGAVGETTSIGSKAGDQSAYASTTWSSLSGDGRYTSLTATVSFISHVFLYDRFTKTSKNLTASGNSISLTPQISANGRYVAFRSAASNLITGDGNGSIADIFVNDVLTGKTELISKAFDGKQADAPSYFSAISGDGQYVAFSSEASNLVAKDLNGKVDAFVRNRKTGKTTRVSVSSTGVEAEWGVNSNAIVDISDDGRYVVFSSSSSNLVAGDTNTEDVFLRDVKTNITTRISQPVRTTGFDGGSTTPSISGDGRFIAFASGSSRLIAGDTDDVNSDIFVYDRVGKITTKITKNATASSVLPTISADGRFVAFMSQASNLVLNDTNSAWDTFVHDRKTGKTARVNVTPANLQSSGDKTFLQSRPTLSADGRFISFESAAKDLTTDDTDTAYTDVFLRDTLLNKLKAANVGLTITAPASVLKGQQYTYTFTVTNLGTAIASQTNVIINLPAALTINSATPSQGSCLKGIVTVCRLGAVGIGASQQVQVKVTAPLVASGIAVSGTAESVEKDSSYANNVKSKTVTIK